jgi:hypothetical protein
VPAWRDKFFENVVNFEIAAYGSSDVLGVGERLPFADNTFDCVFSFAVLEHVKDPSSARGGSWCVLARRHPLLPDSRSSSRCTATRTTTTT